MQAVGGSFILQVQTTQAGVSSRSSYYIGVALCHWMQYKNTRSYVLLEVHDDEGATLNTSIQAAVDETNNLLIFSTETNLWCQLTKKLILAGVHNGYLRIDFDDNK